MNNAKFRNTSAAFQHQRKNPGKVLILGSGGLKIGQAGEFDYSGSQALKALREEGIKTVLINPNIATNQTSEGMADSIYFLPLTPEFVRQVIEKEQPDGILLSFGGQTALNCGLALHHDGILYKYSVEVLGTSISAIELSEDRRLFAEHLQSHGWKTPKSSSAANPAEAAAIAEEIGYPVMVRAGFALGGAGSGLCKTRKQLEARCERAFSISPQVLVEEWLGGWKEIEYEIVRDAYDNCIAVCNMENMDPLGIHTGESIVVAPSQTLTDEEYHRLRGISIKVASSLGIIGECNVQFALNPENSEYRIIEVNARLSRSSALASKATGYPLAYVAAKLALGKKLPDLSNSITGITTACFEPALDYVVIKMPRWDLGKFKAVNRQLGSEMKSVGEVMAVGRNFAEALQKAVRMAGNSDLSVFCRSNEEFSTKSARRELSMPTDKRLFMICSALASGFSEEKIQRLTKIDAWFISEIADIVALSKELKTAGSSFLQDPHLLMKAKRAGFSDLAIARAAGTTEMEARRTRELFGVKPYIKQIDTLAAEFPATTNYLYLTYDASESDVTPARGSIMIPGSGPYRIGSSVEFDWCAVNAIQTCRKHNKKTIVINCNPETVSTDYDICDRLYFEELSVERLLDIYEFECPAGIILSMGGQTSNNLAMPLFNAGALVLGTSPLNIDRAEDRHKFSSLLDTLGIEQPLWKELTTREEARTFAQHAGFPVLIRPSYVLSGAAMNVAWDEASLGRYLQLASDVSAEHPVVISKFIENAKEIEIDAVAQHGRLLYHAISEHIENAGVHSGDATVVFPAQRLYIETIRKILRITEKIAASLRITGPFNIQFLARRNHVMVIECNLRASRSFPFCSKVARFNMIDLAVRAMLEPAIEPINSLMYSQPWVGVKAAQFSFSRLQGADPILGVEMASTGEVGCIASELDDAFMKSMLSVGYSLKGKKVLMSTGPLEDKLDFIDSAEALETMGYSLYATRGTARFLAAYGIGVTEVHWPLEKLEPNILSMMRAREFDLIINIPKNNRQRELKNDYLIRRMAVDLNIPLFTNVKTARQYVESLKFLKHHPIEIEAWDAYR